MKPPRETHYWLSFCSLYFFSQIFHKKVKNVLNFSELYYKFLCLEIQDHNTLVQSFGMSDLLFYLCLRMKDFQCNNNFSYGSYRKLDAIRPNSHVMLLRLSCIASLCANQSYWIFLKNQLMVNFGSSLIFR